MKSPSPSQSHGLSDSLTEGWAVQRTQTLWDSSCNLPSSPRILNHHENPGLTRRAWIVFHVDHEYELSLINHMLVLIHRKATINLWIQHVIDRTVHPRVCNFQRLLAIHAPFSPCSHQIHPAYDWLLTAGWIMRQGWLGVQQSVKVIDHQSYNFTDWWSNLPTLLVNPGPIVIIIVNDRWFTSYDYKTCSSFWPNDPKFTGSLEWNFLEGYRSIGSYLWTIDRYEEVSMGLSVAHGFIHRMNTSSSSYLLIDQSTNNDWSRDKNEESRK